MEPIRVLVIGGGRFSDYARLANRLPDVELLTAGGPASRMYPAVRGRRPCGLPS